MEKGVEIIGFPSIKELQEYGLYPSEERFSRGPVVIVECVQEIPCNPCEPACNLGAIKIGEPITNVPRVNEELCTGCGLCIAGCPGLAIFVVDKTHAPGLAAVSFPYEYEPLPEKGTEAEVVNRKGQVMGRGRIIRVVKTGKMDQTAVLTVVVPLELADEVRGIKRLQRGWSHGQGK